MQPFDLLVLSLATWRLAYMLTKEHGPGNIFTKMRTLPNGGVFDCLYCTSVWVALGLFVLYKADYAIVYYPFAISSAAIMMQSYTGAGLS